MNRTGGPVSHSPSNLGQEVLDDGASRAGVIAKQTMKEVREAIQLP